MIRHNPRYLQKYRRKGYSLDGEEGVIEFIVSKLPVVTRWCVEFGAWDGKLYSNTYRLISESNYKAVLIEADEEKYAELVRNMSAFPDVICKQAFVDISGPNTLDRILADTPIPREFDLLSIDIDGDDYHIWKTLRGYSPSVVIIEINVRDKPGVERVNVTGAPFVWGVTGTSISSMTALAQASGYSLIAHVGCNAIYVLDKYLPLFHPYPVTPRLVFTYELHKAEELTVSEKLSFGLTKYAVQRISRSRLAKRAYRSFRYRLGLTLRRFKL